MWQWTFHATDICNSVFIRASCKRAFCAFDWLLTLRKQIWRKQTTWPFKQTVGICSDGNNYVVIMYFLLSPSKVMREYKLSWQLNIKFSHQSSLIRKKYDWKVSDSFIAAFLNIPGLKNVTENWLVQRLFDEIRATCSLWTTYSPEWSIKNRWYKWSIIQIPRTF